MSLASTKTRPIRLRKRPDLTSHRSVYHGTSFWIIKEPVGLNYYRFPEESHFVLELLDGERNLEQITELYNEQFSPKKLTVERLQSFIGSLHKAGLVQAASTGQGQELLKRRTKTRRQKLFSQFGNILAVRFKGYDPERLLNRMIPYTSWMFSKWTVMLVLLAGLSAIISIFANWDLFMARLPSFDEFFDPMSWGFLAIALACTKILHEFGHGLSCKRFGGECHEMGFMLLVLTPCLYCNVSDSWTLNNKWQRAGIGAAGIYVEAFLATLATFLWWHTEQGLFNQLCLQVMTICSVSTIMFNGNPLLRFDGYFILADILEIPNMQQKSSHAATEILRRGVLGMEKSQNQMMPTRNVGWFALYAVASTLYRWFILFVILMFLNRVFKPYGLQVIGQMIAAMSIATLVGMPLYKVIKFFRNPGMRYQIKMRRALLVGGLIIVAFVALFSVPYPYYVHCDFTVRSRDSITVYVQTPGTVTSVSAQPLQQVDDGQQILQLENLEVETKLIDIQDSIREKQQQLKDLEADALRGNIESRAALASGESELIQLSRLLVQTQQEIDQLTLIAPRSGTLMPVVEGTETQDPENELTRPLAVFEPKNRTAYLPIGLPVCAIGDPADLEAVMSISEDRVIFVAPESTVELKPYAYVSQTIDTQVESIGRLAVSPPAPQQQQSQAPMASLKQAAVPTPQNQYFATAALGNTQSVELKVGSTGKARIRCGSRSLGSRIARWAADTFRFQ